MKIPSKFERTISAPVFVCCGSCHSRTAQRATSMLAVCLVLFRCVSFCCTAQLVLGKPMRFVEDLL